MLMLSLYCKLQALWADRDRGATAVEYGLIVAAIAGVILAVVFLLGARVNQTFTNVCTAMGGCA
jgi:pilus assembly protein Flp/PilA